MAFLSSMTNMRYASRAFLGTWINDKYVGVTLDDLSDYYKLVIIAMIMSFISLLFIKLIPTRE